MKSGGKSIILREIIQDNIVNAIKKKIRNYLLITRLDRPTGWILLFIPCLYGSAAGSIYTNQEINMEITKKEFYWNDDTIEYFKELYSKDENNYRELWNFVKNECDLEDGETYEMLANDLINKIQN